MKLYKMKLGALISYIVNAITNFFAICENKVDSSKLTESSDSFTETRKRLFHTTDHYSDALQKKFDEIVENIKAKLEQGYQHTEEFISTGNFKSEDDNKELALG